MIAFGSQEPQAWAKITWGNAFADIDRNPFSAVDSVTWSQLASVLSTKFESYVGSPLTYEDFRYLCEYSKKKYSVFDYSESDWMMSRMRRVVSRDESMSVS